MKNIFDIGNKQDLFIVRLSGPGAYLAQSPIESDSARMVLLPGAQIPEGAREGDKIRVFLYRDSRDRPVATVNEPLLTLGKTGFLEVISIGDIGAFLNWGLEKDLFLPFKEQTYRVKPGDKVLCGLYLDKSGRLCATMKVYKYLTGAPAGRYRNGAWAEGVVYELNRDFGAFVAVDGEYSGLIPKQEQVRPLKCGERLKVRVARVRKDGRLDLSLRERIRYSIEDDVKKLLAYKDAHGGDFPFNDKSSPEEIKEAFSMSKAQFKRAYGHIKYPK